MSDWFRASLVIAVAGLAATCGKTAAPSAPTQVVTVVTMGPESAATPWMPGFKVQFAAALRQSNGTLQDCTAAAAWTSSDEKVFRPTGQKPGEFVAVAEGDATVNAACDAITGRLAAHVARATLWPISGRVLTAPDGAPVADATVTLGTAASVQTDSAGRYTLVTTDTSVRVLTIAAPGYQTRQTTLRGGELRTLDLDLIARDPLFPFTQYRAMARNGYESPQSAAVAPTQPWTAAPNIYIWTTWKDSGQPVANVDFYVREIRRVIPQLTGGRFQAGTIEFGTDERPQTPGWIHVQFHRSGNWSYVGRSPGQLQFGSDHACNSMAVIHEFGHAMGYWHSGVEPSVMGGGPVRNCDPINLTAEEQLVARVMYSRPRSNVEPDRDPAGAAPLSLRSMPPMIVRCDEVLRRQP